MVQRLGLAVACLPDAPVLILDEPTVSLDPEGAIRFRRFLTTLKRSGKTIVFSSHMLADVEQLADRVAILVGGKLVALESTDRLRESLMRTCRMRVVLQVVSEPIQRAARQSGAEEITVLENSVVITSRPELRYEILRAIEAAGGKIERFATEEVSLEDFYLRYVHEHSEN